MSTASLVVLATVANSAMLAGWWRRIGRKVPWSEAVPETRRAVMANAAGARAALVLFVVACTAELGRAIPP